MPGPRWLPRVARLSRDEWRSRHRTVTTVVAAHVPLLWLYAVHTGRGAAHATLEISAVLVALAVAVWGRRRRTRTLASTLGLLVCSAVVVHLSGGLVESHFHYFVAVALIGLYEEWLVYAIAVGFVALQHGVVDTYGRLHGNGHTDPWLSTGVHTGFILALCAAQLAFWRVSQRAHARQLTAERARQGTERRAQQVLDDSPVGIARVTLTGEYVEVNAAMSALLGRDAADIVGHDYAGFTHPEDLWPKADRLADTAAERRTLQREKRYVRPDGTEVWALVTLSVLDDDAGRPAWFLVHAQDVTERRRLRDARLHLALEAAGTGTWEWDLVAGTVHRSATVARLLGLEADPSGPALSRLHPDDRPHIAAARERAATHDGRFDVEYRIPQPDGSVRWVHSRAELVRDAHGKPLHLLGVSLDVTERHCAEEERAALRAAEQQAAERAIRLQRLTAALAEALTVDQVRAALAQTAASMPGSPASVLSVFDSGRGRWVTPAGDTATTDPAVPVREALRHGTRFSYPDTEGPGATMVLPLVSHGVLHGGWELRWPGEHRRTAEKERFLVTAADLAATTLERAGLFEAQREVAELLQRSLLPARVAEPDGVVTAARYLPAGRAAQVGGDWYDVIPLPDGRIGVAIGDVSGHGVQAAALMGQLRGTLRAYALQDRPPGQVLAALNRAAASIAGLSPEQLATVAYAVVDLAAGQVRHARAGHPPLVLVEPAGDGWDPHLLDGPTGLPLGVDEDAVYREASADLCAGAWLLGYTDGFVERRDEPFDAGLDRLLCGLRGSSRSTPGEVLDELLAIVPGPADDDIALIALQTTREPAPRLLHLPKPRRVLPD